VTGADTSQLRRPGRIAVIGDLAGHLEELRGELLRLGVDRQTLRLPEDLAVIQVGDLVHRGPDSAGVVALVDGYLREQLEQWVQLAGNHEAQYLREPVFDWPETITDEAIETLRSWWSDGRMRIAAVVCAADEDFLVTHAGVTEGFWRQALDSPSLATQAAAAINSFIGTHDDVLFYAGEMLGGGDPNLSAGPVWAATGSELVPSWLGADQRLPFSQVHGHSMIVDRRGRRVRGGGELTNRLTVDQDAAHETVALPGGRIIGIDPGHGRQAHRPWRALVIENATVQ
jgi:hypothetical protein